VKDGCLFYGLSRWLEKQGVYKIVIPSTLIEKPEILDDCWLDKVWILDNQFIVDSFPCIEPSSAPKKDVPLSV
jgi:hypothetical protein